ncbi:uncharacterized protein TNIN_44781 [Trichonephila inaurata madagascariensis]|uniref:DUF4817 domain-containing protein n=1 Tax=Trichonephila inaurata madagascariensis TaxID=2747483 RepID=A0A8X6YA70_9ARAC|nr:uncharacterized protein TNIN_44781 [Trichonephila inaurata madagascariensis]
MHLAYGETKGNGREARRLYKQWFPARSIPSHPTFPVLPNYCEKPVRLPSQTTMQDVCEVLEERVLTRFEAAPSTSTWGCGGPVVKPKVWRIVHDECMHPYHVQKVQSLYTDDYPRQADFVQWMLGMKNNDPRYPAFALFSDEAKFS